MKAWKNKPGYIRLSLTVATILTICLFLVAGDNYRLREINSQQAQEITLRLGQVRTILHISEMQGEANSKLFWGKLDAENRADKAEAENAALKARLAEPPDARRDKFVYAGAVNPPDSGKVHRVLEAHGIFSIIEGSVMYGICVREKERAQAVEILKKDSAEREYYVDFRR